MNDKLINDFIEEIKNLHMDLDANYINDDDYHKLFRLKAESLIKRAK